MMQRIETTATIGPDGTLALDHVLDLPPGRHRVVLLIDDVPEEQQALDWPDFIKATYGSLADVPVEREPQGEYERREAIE